MLELENALRARWDRDTLLVYADALQAAGDPRGELIAPDVEAAEPPITPWPALRRRPLLTAAIVRTPALGIGTQLAVLRVFDAAVPRPLPFADDERLVPPHLQPIERIAGCAYNCEPGKPAEPCETCRSSTPAVRLSPVPFVNLPLGATEDRVLGSLDFERAL